MPDHPEGGNFIRKLFGPGAFEPSVVQILRGGIQLTRMSKLAGALAVTAAFGVAGIAVAEPAEKKTLGNGVFTEKWEGSGSGTLLFQDAMDEAGCQPGIHECHDTLLNVLQAGTVTVKTSSTDPSAVDTDLQLFASNEKGEVKDITTPLAESGEVGPAEQVSAKVKAGFYVARIDFAACANCTVQGEAVLKTSGPAPVVTPPGTTPAAGPGADAPPVVTAKKPGSKKVKAFSGKASDDKGVAKVEVGILQLGKKKGKCKELNAKGKFVASKGKCTEPKKFVAAKGTTAWSLKIKKALSKGKYVLFAKATDTAGQTQGGYGPANKKAFTVKK